MPSRDNDDDGGGRGWSFLVSPSTTAAAAAAALASVLGGGHRLTSSHALCSPETPELKYAAATALARGESVTEYGCSESTTTALWSPPRRSAGSRRWRQRTKPYRKACEAPPYRAAAAAAAAAEGV